MISKPNLSHCPACNRPIQWHDYTGLATQAWHYEDSIITQAIIVDSGEEIDSGDIPSSQQCGYCGAQLNAADFRVIE